MGLKTTKNFITTNAVQNITSVPKRAEKIYVDTRKGDKNYLEPSGLEPVFIHKKVGIFANYIVYYAINLDDFKHFILNLNNNFLSLITGEILGSIHI